MILRASYSAETGACMRLLLTWAASIGIALLAAGCDLNYTQGVGTKLYPVDVAAQTDLQNAYVGEICQQAGLQPAVFDSVTSCGPNPYDAATWWLFVQAGMNDIDQRCDAYMAWLDEAQRSREPVLNESTVQAVVLSRQKEYRDQLIGTSTNKAIAIVSRPAALYALRSYLRLCMPMTIETEINNTIATFERNGADGLQKDSLISAKSAGAPFTPASLVQKPVRAPVTPPPNDIAPFFVEKGLSKEDEEFALNALCFDKNTTSGLPKKDLIQALIAIYEATPDSPRPTADGIIGKSERLAIIKQPNCNAARNYFEKFTFANTVLQPDNSADNLAEFIKLLNRSPAGGALTGSPALGDQTLRDKIRMVRTALGQLEVPSALSSQVTPALITALKKLPKSN